MENGLILKAADDQRYVLPAEAEAVAEDVIDAFFARRVRDVVQVTVGDWPIPIPGKWLKEVNRPQAAAELEALRRSVQRGQPYGDEAWAKRVAVRLGLESTLRPRGRPRKQPEAATKSGKKPNKGS